MFFRKGIRERLEKLEKLLEEENRRALFVVSSEKRVRELERQNRELFDRLMSKNFPEFTTYREEAEAHHLAKFEPLSEDADEQNAGEILEITDEA